MYDFIDRKVGDLDEGGRFLLWSVRFWVRAMSRKTCPTIEVGTAFRQRGLSEALPHFNMTMLILNRHALDNLGFGPVPCGSVHEGEALLLGIFSRMRDASESDMRDTLRLMVDKEWVGPLLAAITALAFDLAEAGLLPHAPAPPVRNYGEGQPTGEGQ
jgi:hypothetical protein